MLFRSRGWTQQGVADQVGISVGQVKKYEKGDSAPNLHALGRIARVFGVSSDEFVFENGKGIAGVKLETELQVPLLGSPNQMEAVQANMMKRDPSFADPE